ncbi:hypothetical protein APHAL10511_004152 [Amanita phalloides]|nr:hypothetical protein APHAL10511_004152 [Amanita phalloides]
MEMDELATLVVLAPPPFIFLHDPVSLPHTTCALKNALATRFKKDATAHVLLAFANGISCFSPRLLYDHIINSLANWTVDWNEGCANWTLPSSARRWNDSFDSFIRGLRTLHSHTRTNKSDNQRAARKGVGKKTKGREKDKGKPRQVEEQVEEEEVRFAIVLEHAERLRDNMPDLLVPLTRLAELTQLDLTVIFVSQVRWEDMKPPLGASPDPYFIDMPPPKKEQILDRLEEYFDSLSKSAANASHSAAAPGPIHESKRSRSRNVNQDDKYIPSPGLYHPNLRQLYIHFVSILCDVCYPFTHDPREIHYIAAARWPGFVQPVLDEHRQRIENLYLRRARRAGVHPDDMDIDEEHDESDEMEGDSDEDLLPLSEDTRMRLSRLLKPTLTTALEELYPRLTNATAWARMNAPPPDLDIISLSRPSSPIKIGQVTGLDEVDSTPRTPRATRTLRSSVPNTPRTPFTPRTPRVVYARSYPNNGNDSGGTSLAALPRLSKFILIAAFLASTNPSKSDTRMFGRGLDEKKRRRRRRASSSPTKAGSGPSKVPQRLLGPTPFPLDRLIAILGCLLEENDVDDGDHGWPPQDVFRVPGEHTDMEIARVGVYTTVVELASMWLLHRTTSVDKLEGPPMFKCGVSYDDVLGLAKELDVPLNDLLWDPA